MRGSGRAWQIATARAHTATCTALRCLRNHRVTPCGTLDSTLKSPPVGTTSACDSVIERSSSSAEASQCSVRRGTRRSEWALALPWGPAGAAAPSLLSLLTSAAAAGIKGLAAHGGHGGGERHEGSDGGSSAEWRRAARVAPAGSSYRGGCAGSRGNGTMMVDGGGWWRGGGGGGEGMWGNMRGTRFPVVWRGLLGTKECDEWGPPVVMSAGGGYSMTSSGRFRGPGAWRGMGHAAVKGGDEGNGDATPAEGKGGGRKGFEKGDAGRVDEKRRDGKTRGDRKGGSTKGGSTNGGASKGGASKGSEKTGVERKGGENKWGTSKGGEGKGVKRRGDEGKGVKRRGDEGKGVKRKGGEGREQEKKGERRARERERSGKGGVVDGESGERLGGARRKRRRAGSPGGVTAMTGGDVQAGVAREEEKEEEEQQQDHQEAGAAFADVGQDTVSPLATTTTTDTTTTTTPPLSLPPLSFEEVYATHLAPISPPFASYSATRDNALTLMALGPSPATLAAIFRSCSPLFLLTQTGRIRAALDVFSAHGLPESLFLSVIRRVPELILDSRLDDVSSDGGSCCGGNCSNGSSSSSRGDSNMSGSSAAMSTSTQEHTSPPSIQHLLHHLSLPVSTALHHTPPSLPTTHFPPTHLPHIHQVLLFLSLHLPPPTVAKLLHSAACRVFRSPLPTLLLHLSALQAMLAPPHSLLLRYPLALRFSPQVLASRLSRLAEIVPLTEGGEGGEGGEGKKGSRAGEGEGEAGRKKQGRRREISWDPGSLLPIPPLPHSLSFSAHPTVLSHVRMHPHILHASTVTMQEVVTTLTTLFGRPGTSYVLARHPALLTVSPRTVEEAMFALVDIFGEAAMVDMIQRDPGIIQVRRGTIKAKIDFILGEMRRSKEDIAVWPTVLLRSLPRVLVPRYYLVGRKDAHAAKVLSLPSIFSSPHARFMRRWGISAEEWEKALMVGEVWAERRNGLEVGYGS